jgi:uncharacterized protein (DUF1800 family)
MELFTFGVANYVETDVYARRRVFTGWNLKTTGRGDGDAYYAFNYVSGQHDTGEKGFSSDLSRWRQTHSGARRRQAWADAF